MFVYRTKLQRARFIVLKFMTISLEEEQHGEDEMQDVDANVNTLDEEAGPSRKYYRGLYNGPKTTSAPSSENIFSPFR